VLKFEAQEEESWTTMAQQIFNLHRSMALIQCHYCSSSLDTVERLLVDNEQSQPLFSRCMRFVCADCAQSRPPYTTPCSCANASECSIAPVSTTIAGMEEAPVSRLEDLQRSSIGQLPTKVASLVTQLAALPPGVKRCVFQPNK
jgi:hypothetical protein